ncbi:MAG: K(+)-transporting ATPase subunit F [Armatimonadota bacterium]
MSPEYLVIGLITLGLFFYLIYALIHPERL